MSRITTFLLLAPPARLTLARQESAPPRQRTVAGRTILSIRRTASITRSGWAFWM